MLLFGHVKDTSADAPAWWDIHSEEALGARPGWECRHLDQTPLPGGLPADSQHVATSPDVARTRGIVAEVAPTPPLAQRMRESDPSEIARQFT